MKNKLFFILFLLIGIVSTNVKAQEAYRGGIGLRFGTFESGLTGKYFVSENTAYEGILAFRGGSVAITGLYEIHAPLTALEVPNLNWFYGFGAHIGGVSDKYKRGNETYSGGLLLGVDGIIGTEWLIPDAPVSIGADLRPRLELAKGPFLNLEFALTARYTF